MNANKKQTALKFLQKAATRLVTLIDLNASQEIIEGEIALINKFLKKMHQGDQ